MDTRTSSLILLFFNIIIFHGTGAGKVPQQHASRRLIDQSEAGVANKNTAGSSHKKTVIQRPIQGDTKIIKKESIPKLDLSEEETAMVEDNVNAVLKSMGLGASEENAKRKNEIAHKSDSQGTLDADHTENSAKRKDLIGVLKGVGPPLRGKYVRLGKKKDLVQVSVVNEDTGETLPVTVGGRVLGGCEWVPANETLHVSTENCTANATKYDADKKNDEPANKNVQIKNNDNYDSGYLPMRNPENPLPLKHPEAVAEQKPSDSEQYLPLARNTSDVNPTREDDDVQKLQNNILKNAWINVVKKVFGKDKDVPAQSQGALLHKQKKDSSKETLVAKSQTLASEASERAANRKQEANKIHEDRIEKGTKSMKHANQVLTKDDKVEKEQEFNLDIKPKMQDENFEANILVHGPESALELNAEEMDPTSKDFSDFSDYIPEEESAQDVSTGSVFYKMSEWGPWSTCSETCGSKALKIRTRKCIEAQTKKPVKLSPDMPCEGSSVDWKNCKGLRKCPETTLDLSEEDVLSPSSQTQKLGPSPKNPWSSWSRCSKSCGSRRLKIRERKCATKRLDSGVCIQPTMQWAWCKDKPCQDEQTTEVEESKTNSIENDGPIPPLKEMPKKDEDSGNIKYHGPPTTPTEAPKKEEQDSIEYNGPIPPPKGSKEEKQTDSNQYHGSLPTPTVSPKKEQELDSIEYNGPIPPPKEVPTKQKQTDSSEYHGPLPSPTVSTKKEQDLDSIEYNGPIPPPKDWPKNDQGDSTHGPITPQNDLPKKPNTSSSDKTSHDAATPKLESATDENTPIAEDKGSEDPNKEYLPVSQPEMHIHMLTPHKTQQTLVNKFAPEQEDDCTLEKWSQWSTCSQTCGAGGLHIRTRNCQCNPGKECKHKLVDWKKCKLSACPDTEHDDYGSWTGFSKCSKSCGGGWRKRTRRCNSKLNKNCGHDLLIGIQVCNKKSCPRRHHDSPLKGDASTPDIYDTKNPETTCGFNPCNEFGCLDRSDASCIPDMNCNPVFYDLDGNFLGDCRGWQRFYLKMPETFCGFDTCKTSACMEEFGRCNVDLDCKPVIVGANNRIINCHEIEERRREQDLAMVSQAQAESRAIERQNNVNLRNLFNTKENVAYTAPYSGNKVVYRPFSGSKAVYKPYKGEKIVPYIRGEKVVAYGGEKVVPYQGEKVVLPYKGEKVVPYIRGEKVVPYRAENVVPYHGEKLVVPFRGEKVVPYIRGKKVVSYGGEKVMPYHGEKVVVPYRVENVVPYQGEKVVYRPYKGDEKVAYKPYRVGKVAYTPYTGAKVAYTPYRGGKLVYRVGQ